MLPAVDFDDQPGLVADKIGSVGADRDLAAELASVHSNMRRRRDAFHFSACAAGGITPTLTLPHRGGGL